MNSLSSRSNDPLLHAAITAALAAGEVIQEGRRSTLSIEEKSMANFVTHIDRAAEAAIRQILGRMDPAWPVLGEEEGGEVAGSSRFWVVDPLDGTTNYIKGIQYYSVSIALAERDPASGLPRPVCGVVYNPVSGELFHALAGGGAWLAQLPPGAVAGGPGSSTTAGQAKVSPEGLPASVMAALAGASRLGVHQVDRLEEAVLITGFYYDRGERMRQTLRQIEEFFDRGMICVRRFGSAALDCCQVAAGRCEGFWEHLLNPWDYAAGQLLVQEAGGVMCNWAGRETGLEAGAVLACAPGLRDKMLAVLNGPTGG